MSVGPPKPSHAPPTAAPPDSLQEAQIRENMWIEIIRHMERIYADLAQAQMEMERSTQELREAKEFADNVIRSMVNALVVADQWGAITLMNHAALALFDRRREELAGRPLKMLFADQADPPAVPWSVLWNRLLDGEVVSEVEAVVRDRQETRIPVAVSGSVLHDSSGNSVGVVIVVRDLRETKRLLASAAGAVEAARVKAAELAEANEELRHLQDHLIQSEKMSSLGRLSAGVAHEINNPLGGIVVYAHLLLEDTGTDDTRRENIEKIVVQALRCREIVQGLLGFARPAASGEVLLDVNAVLRVTLDVFDGQALFHNVEIVRREEPDLPPILGDAGQLQQAFSNIVLNAAQAMNGDGRLTVATCSVPDEKTIRVVFDDTGPGIPPEHVPHLFEPFFTTKETGQGTGLGLAISYGLVKRHGGTIHAEVPAGGGARFVVSLPAAESRATPRP